MSKAKTKRTPAPYKSGASYMTGAQLPGYIEEKRGFKPSPSLIEKWRAQGRLVPVAK